VKALRGNRTKLSPYPHLLVAFLEEELQTISVIFDHLSNDRQSMLERGPTQEQLAAAVYEYAMSLQRAGDSPGQIKRQLVE
jgi:hypothetical protein